MAIGSTTFSGIGGAVQDLFSADALRVKAKGNRAEAEQYGLAAELARQNEQFTKTSTEIKQYQTQRSIETAIGGQQAAVASSGFTAGGSALDIMRDSASQGALTKAVVGQQGLIQEAAYEEQAKSYDIMQKTALMTADSLENSAFGMEITGVIKGVAGLATFGLK